MVQNAVDTRRLFPERAKAPCRSSTGKGADGLLARRRIGVKI